MRKRNEELSGGQQSVSGSESVNQAARDINYIVNNNTIVQYVSKTSDAEIETISRRVFGENYLQLTERAHAEAARLAEEFIHIFLDLLNEEAPETIYAFDTPRMLSAMYSSQKAYAESGDKEMATALARMLMRLAVEKPRTATDVLYRQAVECIPKLAQEHVHALSVIVVLTQLWESDVETVDQVIDSLDTALSPFYGKVPKSNFDYQYMSGCGAGQTLIGPTPYSRISETYMWLLHHTTEDSSLPEALASGDYKDAMECVNDTNNLYRVSKAGYRKHGFEGGHFPAFGLGNPVQVHLQNKRFSDEELRAAIAPKNPELVELLDTLRATSALAFELSAIGHTIGLENFKSIGGDTTVSAEDNWKDL